MLYREPSARISLFDNSDVVVTSWDGVPCDFSTTNQNVCTSPRANADFNFCSELGIPGDNACNYNTGNGYSCDPHSFSSGCPDLFFFSREACHGEGDFYTTNSTGNLF